VVVVVVVVEVEVVVLVAVAVVVEELDSIETEVDRVDDCDEVSVDDEIAAIAPELLWTNCVVAKTDVCVWSWEKTEGLVAGEETLRIVFVDCDKNSVVVDFEACSVCWLATSDESELTVFGSDASVTVEWGFVSVESFVASWSSSPFSSSLVVGGFSVTITPGGVDFEEEMCFELFFKCWKGRGEVRY
jgi:hypothetical protein